MIKTAIKFQNNMVMVFDKEGEQISKYQGQYEDVKRSILRDAQSGANQSLPIFKTAQRRQIALYPAHGECGFYYPQTTSMKRLQRSGCSVLVPTVGQ